MADTKGAYKKEKKDVTEGENKADDIEGEDKKDDGDSTEVEFREPIVEPMFTVCNWKSIFDGLLDGWIFKGHSVPHVFRYYYKISIFARLHIYLS